ncbi:MAG: PDZ domain-containing protein, partial [candidate division Zixibacteria bacterium]
AIPINLARAIVPDLIENGRASRGWLGIGLSDVSEREAKRQGMEAVRGIRIDTVFTQSPAQQAGLKKGDIVVTFNSREVINTRQFSVLVSTLRKGLTVPVEVLRDGERLSLHTSVADREEFLASLSTAPQSPASTAVEWLGMELVTFSTSMANQIGIEHIDGVYVTRVYPGSVAYRASIAEGTIVLQVNNEPITSVSDLQARVEELGRDTGRVPLIVQEPDGSIARKVVRLSS